MKRLLILLSLLATLLPSMGMGRRSAIVQYEQWLDSSGNPINAHGGGMLYHDGKYYWYGEYKVGETYLPADATWERYRTDVTGVSCYSSYDLLNWNFEGVVLKADTENPESAIHPSQVLERPKVVFNKNTGKFVMWFHADSPDYTKAAAGVAVADSPAGPFRFVEAFRPNGAMSRDQTLFVDDDGKAYQFAASEDNKTLYINELTDDYLRPTGRYTRNFIDMSREAPAVFKHDGKYYILSSGCTGWDPNQTQLGVADSIMGEWKIVGEPLTGPEADKSFYSQVTYVQPVADRENCYIAMFDRWNKLDLGDSRYVWLMIEINDGKISIPWRERWDFRSLSGCCEKTPREEIYADKRLAAANERIYPEPDPERAIAAAPEGYCPFHISTYARHGSRFLLSSQDYESALNPLAQADAAGTLTDTGRKVMLALDKMLAIASENRYGELTAAGCRQHHGIAKRMVGNFPEIFADSAWVDAKSTDVMRCAMSMMAECLELQKLNPNLKITHDASRADMYYMNDVPRADSIHRKWRSYKDSEREKVKDRIDPWRVFSQLFSDKDWVVSNIPDPRRAYYNIFRIAVNMQNHDYDDLDIMWLFTPEECYECWLVSNVDWYIHSGNTSLTNYEMPYQQQNLMKEILRDGDQCAKTRQRTATLRFGHESIVLPTVVLLGIDGFDYDTDDLDSVSEHWAAYKAFPMAANIQFVFYEKTDDPDADVLVRVLLNEADARLPLRSSQAPFYKWSDFSDYYKSKILAAN